MRNLIIDIGNTRIKTAVFENEGLAWEGCCSGIEELVSFAQSVEFDACIISSVTYSEQDLRSKLRFEFLFLGLNTNIPFKNAYATPQTLGVDRKAAVMGARGRFPNADVLAIDLGSCITYDLLDRFDRYLGGGISPGLQMRFRAMHQLTARLPLVTLTANVEPDLIGSTTDTCMQSGVYFGMFHEMQGTIEAYRTKYPDLKVIICGGDAKIFERITKDHIFVIPNLVLHGLNRILSYNVHYQ